MDPEEIMNPEVTPVLAGGTEALALAQAVLMTLVSVVGVALYGGQAFVGLKSKFGK